MYSDFDQSLMPPQSHCTLSLFLYPCASILCYHGRHATPLMVHRLIMINKHYFLGCSFFPTVPGWNHVFTNWRRLVCDFQGFYHIRVFLPVFENIQSFASISVLKYLLVYMSSI